MRLDDQPICIPTNPTVSGSFPNKPICIMADQVTDPFLQLETRPRSRGNRCLHTELGTSEGLCQPSLVSDLSLYEQSKKPRSQTSDGDTSMAIPTMVPSTTWNAGGSSPTTPTDSIFDSEPHQSGVHNDRVPNLVTWGILCFMTNIYTSFRPATLLMEEQNQQ